MRHRNDESIDIGTNKYYTSEAPQRKSADACIHEHNEFAAPRNTETPRRMHVGSAETRNDFLHAITGDGTHDIFMFSTQARESGTGNRYVAPNYAPFCTIEHSTKQ